MAVLETDDQVHKFQGRWIARRGAAMPIVARYSAWVAGIAALFPLLVIGRATRMPVEVLVPFVIGGAVLFGKFAADHLGGEYTVSAWFGVATANVTGWRRHRSERPSRAYRIHDTKGN